MSHDDFVENNVYDFSNTFAISTQILPNDPRSRRLFVTSGGLKKVQEIQAEPGSKLAEYIKIINCCFPEEIVRCEIRFYLLHNKHNDYYFYYFF